MVVSGYNSVFGSILFIRANGDTPTIGIKVIEEIYYYNL